MQKSFKRALIIAGIVVLALFWSISYLRSLAVSRDTGGFTLLHRAAVEGSMSKTAFWVLFGAQVSARSQNGQTPLHLAVTPDVVRVLLTHGADLNARTEGGDTPLYMAIQLEQPLIVDELLKHGAKVNMQNGTGETPLHLACQKNNKIICAMLLSNGADARLRDIFGQTPLQHARKMQSVDALRTLKHFGVTK